MSKNDSNSTEVWEKISSLPGLEYKCLVTRRLIVHGWKKARQFLEKLTGRPGEVRVGGKNYLRSTGQFCPVRGPAWKNLLLLNPRPVSCFDAWLDSF